MSRYCGECGAYHGRTERHHRAGWCTCGAHWIANPNASVRRDGVLHGIHRCAPERS